MGFRAEDVRLSNEQGSIEVDVTEIDRLGESTMVHCRVCGAQVKEPEDDNLRKSKSTEKAILARLDPDANLAPGDRVNLTIVSGRVLWFDPDTGENLLKERK